MKEFDFVPIAGTLLPFDLDVHLIPARFDAAGRQIEEIAKNDLHHEGGEHDAEHGGENIFGAPVQERRRLSNEVH